MTQIEINDLSLYPEDSPVWKDPAPVKIEGVTPSKDKIALEKE